METLPVPPVDPGEPPVDGIPAWDAGKVYQGGDKVSHKGVVYQAKWWTQGDDPVKGGPWAPVSQ